jgi:hypothetical protein
MRLFQRVTLNLLRPHENTNLLWLTSIVFFFPCRSSHAKVQYARTTIYYHRVKHRSTLEIL